jgi:hypothetical protein
MYYHDDDLVSPTELSRSTGIAAKTLANWRVERKGPPFVKFGRRVFYHRASLARWLKQSEKRTNADRNQR